MNASVLMILLVAAIVILAVLVYNMYQENEYRKKIRHQFGNADRDALMDSHVGEVRDAEGGMLNPLKKKNPPQPEESQREIDTPLPNQEWIEEDIISEQPEEVQEYTFAETTLKSIPQKEGPLLMDLQDLSRLDLPWFNRHFDYLAYISLREAKELNAVPRLSDHRHVTLAGCTSDGRFQLAEPIPNVYYQAFVIGLQAIGRLPLAGTPELEDFGERVGGFAENMNGHLWLTKVKDFLDVARPLDEVCARIDQIIAIHLISRNMIAGTDLRLAAETLGFVLSYDGHFCYPSAQNPLFLLTDIKETPFTATLLSSQKYKGISMLFDITKVPQGEKNFNKFMDLSVKLSSALSLDLVDDQMNELSTQSLHSIGDYIHERHHEMKEIGITPGSDLAKRIFS